MRQLNLTANYITPPVSLEKSFLYADYVARLDLCQRLRLKPGGGCVRFATDFDVVLIGAIGEAASESRSVQHRQPRAIRILPRLVHFAHDVERAIGQNLNRHAGSEEIAIEQLRFDPRLKFLR